MFSFLLLLPVWEMQAKPPLSPESQVLFCIPLPGCSSAVRTQPLSDFQVTAQS